MFRLGFVALLVLTGCGSSAAQGTLLNLSYALGRKYTGENTNSLTISVDGESDDRFRFSVSSETASLSVAEDVDLPLEDQRIDVSFDTEGVHSLDFIVRKQSGVPYLYEVLSWEFSKDPPPQPIISFAREATNSLSQNLLVSDSRPDTVDSIWVKGDVDALDEPLAEGGYWEDLAAGVTAVRIALTPGDGIKTVDAKFRNVFGIVGELGEPAQIRLKQTPPSGCAAELLTPKIANNKVSLQLFADDPFQTYYSVTGNVKSVVDSRAFSDGEVVYVYVEPSAGDKKIVVSITDIAENVCLVQELDLTLDPDFVGERIDIADHEYWTDSEAIRLSAYFDHFSDQEPLQIRITGDVSGPNVNTWLDVNEDIDVTLNPSTSGNRKIFAQYKDRHGDESYLITKQIYLKPEVAVTDGTAPSKNLTISNIAGLETVSISGCEERYSAVAYQESYPCAPTAAAAEVVWTFKDGSTLTRTASF
jgi:hypothetical protein